MSTLPTEPGVVERPGFAAFWLAMARGEQVGCLGVLLKWALVPLELLYRFGLMVYGSFEKMGLRSRTKLPVRTVSIGNLTLGGTGKTGVVQKVAEELISKAAVAVLLRGYGRKGHSEAVIVSDGQTVRSGWQECGDEAVLLARALPQLAVLSGKDRAVTGRIAVEQLDRNLVLLDDGLQFWQLHRDLDIVLIDSRCPFGNGHLLPAGMLREPVGVLKKAGVIIVTHTNEVEQSRIQRLERRLGKIAPGAERFHARYVPVSVTNTSGEKSDVGRLAGKRVVALAAIGSPGSFVSTLSEAGAVVVAEMFFADHHPFGMADIASVSDAAANSNADFIVTTRKDYVKLEGLELPDNLMVLDVTMQIANLDGLIDLIWPERTSS